VAVVSSHISANIKPGSVSIYFSYTAVGKSTCNSTNKDCFCCCCLK